MAKTVRISLVLPPELYDRLKRQSKINYTTTSSLIRKYIKMGLAVDDPNDPLVLKSREGGKDIDVLAI